MGTVTHTVPTGQVSAMVAPGDGAWPVTSHLDGTVEVWDPATGTATHTLPCDPDEATAMAVSPDGTWLATSHLDGTVRIWDPDETSTRTALRSGTALSHLSITEHALTAVGEGRPFLASLPQQHS